MHKSHVLPGLLVPISLIGRRNPTLHWPNARQLLDAITSSLPLTNILVLITGTRHFIDSFAYLF